MKGCVVLDLLIEQMTTVNQYLERYGVKFGLYKENKFVEQLFPFDPLPRIISAKQYDFLEKGLTQRAHALNLFLNDIYSKRSILKNKIVPEPFVFAGSGFLAECQGIKPPNGVYNHISGIDLIEAEDGWFILEDNLRVPSGASYPMIARDITRKISPETFEINSVYDNRNYANLLKKMFEDVNCGGISVILTPGRYNSAFFEHAYLAEMTGATLVFPGDLNVENNYVYYKSYTGKKEKVGTIYHRISDEYMDPMVFEQDSVIGIPHVMEVYRRGNVALVNAPGNGIADDKGIYYFVPQMIEYYLGEQPILKNAPTYLPYYKKDRAYVLENLHRLVIKDVSEAGGYGVLFGHELSKEKLKNLQALILKEPRRFIAQEVIEFLDLEVLEGNERVMRKADLRSFVVQGNDINVWKSGLSRFSRNPDSYMVNSSQGGGFKDTWVISH